MNKKFIVAITFALLITIIIWWLVRSQDAEDDTPIASAHAVHSMFRDAPPGPSAPDAQKQTLRQSAATENIDSNVRSLLNRLSTAGITPDNYAAQASPPVSPRLKIDPKARMQLYVRLEDTDDETLQQLRSLGAEIELVNANLNLAQLWIRFNKVAALSRLGKVKRIEPPSYARLQAGSRMTEGDAILVADHLRQLGLDGNGVRIGVISDGANNIADSQATGDLPNGIPTYGSCAVEAENLDQCNPGSVCNEGTAMMEIVHDIAPGAELAMGDVGTSLEFIQRVDDLVNNFHADVIVDDLGFLGEPFFADGPVAKAVDSYTDQVVFVSAAGNYSHSHYEADYIDGGGGYHDFGAAIGDAANNAMGIQVPAGGYVLSVLQWNDPFGASTNDYDLYLVDSNGQSLCPNCVSVSDQSGSSDPLEFICFHNTQSTAITGWVFVGHYAGSARRLELLTLGSGVARQYNVPEGSVFGHPAIPAVIAVGAINAQDAGNDDIAFYSSEGPSRIDFPSIEIRAKPDVTGIDGVSVTGVGGFVSTFYGTSAAAPHVAAIAALLEQVAGSKTPADIRASLRNGATDLGDVGQDSVFGYGRVNAFNALTALNPDVDGDGISDNDDSDDDNDGIPDTVEVAYGLSPFINNCGKDTDSDQYDDCTEYLMGTDPTQATRLTLDVDGDGNADAMTDAVIILRHEFGFTRPALFDRATGADATRSQAQMAAYLSEVDRSLLDVDGDNEIRPLTDGLLIVRRLFGFSDAALVNGSVDQACTRCTSTDIAGYLDAARP